MRLLLLVGCGKFCISSNKIAKFFYHQYLWKQSIEILKFSAWVSHQQKAASEGLPLLFVCGHEYLISNQTEQFFHQQYYWKEQINVFDFLYRDNHQGKIISIGCVIPSVPLVQSDYRILRSTISLEGVKWCLCLTIFIFSLF